MGHKKKMSQDIHKKKMSQDIDKWQRGKSSAEIAMYIINILLLLIFVNNKE